MFRVGRALVPVKILLIHTLKFRDILVFQEPDRCKFPVLTNFDLLFPLLVFTAYYREVFNCRESQKKVML